LRNLEEKDHLVNKSFCVLYCLQNAFDKKLKDENEFFIKTAAKCD